MKESDKNTNRKIRKRIKNEKWNQYKKCKLKMPTTFTTSRINSIAQNLKKKEEIYLKRYRKVTSLLIFLGEISEKNREILEDSNIEV